MATYVVHVKQLLHVAHRAGLPELTVEPMSCSAEPPTSPDEQRDLLVELTDYHQRNADTAAPGYCIDVAHGWTDRKGRLLADHWALIEAGLPWCRELHLKNTDAAYQQAFGFTSAERGRGVIDVAHIRRFLADRSGQLPVNRLVGYLEIPGPKLGRDATDPTLEPMLRGSLRHLRETWVEARPATRAGFGTSEVLIAPSLMCADQIQLGNVMRVLESAGCDMVHIDIMDGVFVPNLALGFEPVRALRPLTRLPFDVHLMVEDNDRFVPLAKAAGADRVTVHAESCKHLDRTLAAIRALGACRPGSPWPLPPRRRPSATFCRDSTRSW